MNSFYGRLYFLLKNATYLSKSSMPKKAAVAGLYLRMVLKSLLFEKLLRIKLKSQKMFGYTAHTFTYDLLILLVGEIFIRGEYYFAAENASPVILDCGANIGVATLFFKWLYPHSTVHAFEPDKTTFALLEKNIKDNHLENVHVYNCAITDADGFVDFFSSASVPGSLRMSLYSSRMDGVRTRVTSLSLVSFIRNTKLEQIDFAKIDIEGAEGPVIKDLDAAGQLVKIKQCAIEYHHNVPEGSDFASLLSILQRRGYTYQIDAHQIPLNSPHAMFQDIIIRACATKSP